MVGKVVRSKQKSIRPVQNISKTGISVNECYCRFCMKTKNVSNFYQAVDDFLDKNGYFSICKGCIGSIYVGYYKSERDLYKALYKTCMIINLKYDLSAIDAVKSQYDGKKDYDDPSLIGIYKARLISVQKEFGNKTDNLDLKFHFEIPYSKENYLDDMEDVEYKMSLQDYKMFWGADLNLDDYLFLEEKLSEWKRDYSCQNKAELFLMKELCFKELDLKNARLNGNTNVDSILTSMDKLLKSAALTPAQSNASGGAKDTWGLMMKQIEMTRPAEFYKDEDKNLFKDFDNIGAYITNYIKRPMLNFWGASKSFELVGEDESFELLDNTSEEEVVKTFEDE